MKEMLDIRASRIAMLRGVNASIPSAEKKVQECQHLFQTFAENDKCKEKSKAWHIKF